MMPPQHISVEKLDEEIPLVTFAHGTIKKESKKRKLKLSVYGDTKHKTSSKRKKILIADSDKMSYKGDNFGPLALCNHHTQLYVAELNKSTGKMRMFPSEIFTMHPAVKVDQERDQVDLGSMSFREKADFLTEAFGSRKQKKAVQKRQKSAIAEKTILAALGSAIDPAVTAHQSHTVPAVQQTSSAIPPCNVDAKTPSEAYSLDDIIGHAEIESLRNATQNILTSGSEKLKDWQEKKTCTCGVCEEWDKVRMKKDVATFTMKYFSSVLTRLKILPADEEKRWKKACLLLYLQYMLTTFSYKYDQFRKKDVLPAEWPTLVKRLILDRFTLKLDGSRRCAPKRLRDLLLSHILVLCLIMDDFFTPLDDLMKDLKMSAAKLQMHARALGCRIKTEMSTDASGNKVVSYTAMLKVPLKFPEVGKGRRAKK